MRGKAKYPVESGITVLLTSGEYFRFQDAPTYRRLSGEGLKEMDFGWWDPGRSELVLLECQSWQAGAAAAYPDLWRDKAVHSLMMLGVVWLDTATGRQLATELANMHPAFPGERPALRLVFVVNTGRKENVNPLMDRLRQQLRGVLGLWDLRADQVLVLDVETAVGAGLSVRA